MQVEYPLINGTQMPRSAPRNEEAVRWYHDRVVEWARRSIMASTAATGPWWDPNARAWAFRQGSSVIISEDGLEDISPLAPPLHPRVRLGERRSRVRIPVCALRASSAGGCQRSTGDPRLILAKGYRLVVLGGYGRTDPLLKKPFYPNGAFAWGVMGAL
ncbi:unnamed protein product [Closterium sp. NIES-54]